MARGSMRKKAWIHFLMVAFVPCFFSSPERATAKPSI
jgi:hypothetical protein